MSGASPDPTSGEPADSALVRFRLFGFPVGIHTSFLLIIGIFGLFPGQTVRNWMIWMLVAGLAILVHELGHALTARMAGSSPSIALVGLGGVTTFVPRDPDNRAVSIGISAAGPGIGLLAGAGLWLVNQNVEPAAGSWAETALVYGLFTTIIWSVLNLLPALPLDGGHILQELLPGTPPVRLRRAAAVSIVVALLVGLAAVLAGYVFFSIFTAILVLTNALTLRNTGASAGGRPGQAGPVQVIVDLVLQGRYADARAALSELSELQAAEGGEPVDLAIHGLVMAVSGEREQGVQLLLQEIRRRPGDPLPVRALALAHVALDEFDQFGALLSGAYGRAIPPDLVARAQVVAMQSEQDDVAARLGETFLVDLPPSSASAPAELRQWIAAVALQSARARARTGEADQALTLLEAALGWGYADAGHLRSDPAFDRLRADARFEGLVCTLEAPGGSVSG